MYQIIDFETGGLAPVVNPPLSVSVVLSSSSFEPADSLNLKLLPPPGTLLEIPEDRHMGLHAKNKKVAFWLDVRTMKPVLSPSPDVLIITGIAAEVNGYVRLTPKGEWDLDSVAEWHEGAVELPEAEDILVKFTEKHSGSDKALAVAHNAVFDTRFASVHFPRYYEKLVTPWICTMQLMRVWRDKRGEAGTAKLADLAAKAGRVQQKPHESLSDCLDCLAGLAWLAREKVLA